MKYKKTNAMRELDKAAIAYTVLCYPVDEHNLAADYVAQKIQQPLEIVFKTLAILNEKKELIIACIPGDQELDLKKLAKVAKNKKVEMLELKELLNQTGYVRGGCSPLAIKKRHSTFMQQTALNFPEIVVSAGQRGLQIKLNPQDLINYLHIQVADIIQ